MILHGPSPNQDHEGPSLGTTDDPVHSTDNGREAEGSRNQDLAEPSIATGAHLDPESSRWSLDPIVALPPEISWRCILEALEFGRECPSQLISFSTVSPRWQNLIYSTPELWACIHIHGSMPDLLATIAVFTHLSAAMPIDLVIWTEPDAQWTYVSSLLTPHAGRIRSITFRYPATYAAEVNTTKYISSLSVVINSLGPLPGLDVLDFGHSPALDLSIFQLLDLSPDVRIKSVITLPSTLHPFKDHKHLNHVTSITTSDSLGSIASARRALVQLSELKLEEGTSLNTEDEESTWLDMDGLFPSLTSFAYYQEYTGNVKQFIIHTGARLFYLELKLPAYDLMGMIDCLAVLVSLKHLNLIISEWESTGPFHSIAHDIVVPGICSLSLEAIFGDQSIEPHHGVAFRELFGAFTVMYPGVKQIRFRHILDIMRYAGPYLEGLPFLEFLSLGNIELKPATQRQFRLPCLQQLIVKEFDTINWVLIPDIRSLAIRRRTRGGELIWNQPNDLHRLMIGPQDPNSRLVLGGHLDPRELNLRLFELHQRFDISRLRQLVCIRLSTSHLMNPHGNDLCREIIYRPTTCPSLQEVEFSDFVDWDLLFIMLERRNFSHSDCRMIRKVTIPYIPFVLRQPLCHLLKGKRMGRPPNIDLSLEATREVMCDPMIPGCVACLKNMIPGCIAEVKQAKPKHSLRLDDLFHTNQELPSELPSDIALWMLHRQHLVEEWKKSFASFQSKFDRRKRCYTNRTNSRGWGE